MVESKGGSPEDGLKLTFTPLGAPLAESVTVRFWALNGHGCGSRFARYHEVANRTDTQIGHFLIGADYEINY